MAGPKTVVKTAGGQVFKAALSNEGVLKGTNLILMYHRVVRDAAAGGCDPALCVTPAVLEMHLTQVRRYFQIVPLDEALRCGDRRLCAITFDDGWRDNYEFAYPILKAMQVPATIFLSVLAVGEEEGFWFQRLWDLAVAARKNGIEGDFVRHFRGVVPDWRRTSAAADSLTDLTALMKPLSAAQLEDAVAEGCSRLGLKVGGRREIMDWDEVAEMGRHGATFGSHGLRHHLLTAAHPDDKKREIFDSLALLRKRATSFTPYFSYPNGNWDADCVSYVRAAGYRGAVTTRTGVNRIDSEQFALSRIGLHEEISHTPSLFWFRIFQAVAGGSRTI